MFLHGYGEAKYSDEQVCKMNVAGFLIILCQRGYFLWSLFIAELLLVEKNKKK